MIGDWPDFVENRGIIEFHDIFDWKNQGLWNKLHELVMKFFYQSDKFWKILKKKIFAWNVLKHKVKPKNSRNSTFFKKLKFPPYFWKTLVKFSSPKCSLWYAVIFISPREGALTFFHGNQLFSADGWKPIKSRLKADGWKAGFL